MSDERSLQGTQIPTKRRWIVFGLAAATSFILYLHRYTWNFIRPELMDEYKFSNQEMGILDTAFYASYSLGQIPGGIICDMFGPHLFVGIIIAIWSLTMPCLGLAGSMNGLIAARLGFGAAQAGCYPSLAKVTREWFPIGQRTTLQGLVASFFGRSGGAMSSLLFGSVLMGVCGFSWRVALTMLAVLGLILAVLFIWQCRNRPQDDPRCNEAERTLIRAGDETPDDDQPKVLPLMRALKNASLRMFVVQQYMNAGADYVYSVPWSDRQGCPRDSGKYAVVGWSVRRRSWWSSQRLSDSCHRKPAAVADHRWLLRKSAGLLLSLRSADVSECAAGAEFCWVA
jgi:MFS transporter, ACS family, glucarate transporter